MDVCFSRLHINEFGLKLSYPLLILQINPVTVVKPCKKL